MTRYLSVPFCDEHVGRDYERCPVCEDIDSDRRSGIDTEEYAKLSRAIRETLAIEESGASPITALDHLKKESGM